MKKLIALLIALAPAAAFARTAYEDLITLRDQVQYSCRNNVCGNGYAIQTVYRNGQGPLNPAVAHALQNVAFNQAQIWGDTILEGDYEVTGQIRLEEVRVITRAGTVVGYQIVYAGPARDPHGQGQIREACWVHTNLETAMVAEADQAIFVRR